MREEAVFDLHTHHDRCNHAEGKIADYIESAINQEIDIIGISDHSPFFYSEEDALFPNIAMKKSEFKTYVNEVLFLKEKYKDKIEVLLGVESDYFSDHIDLYKSVYKDYPFDYIIGSVHFVDDISVFDKDHWNQLNRDGRIKRKRQYYHLIEQSAKSGLFQILGHIDVMKTLHGDFLSLPNNMIDNTLKVIAQEKVAIEINTSGEFKGCGWYPAADILERAHHYGIDVTFGSDAHVPERVGDEFETVKRVLKDIGYKEWCYFRNKKKVYSPL